MKKSKKLKELKNKLCSSLFDIEKIIDDSIDEIKKDYALKFIKEKNKLLTKISVNEKINLEYLKSKYLKNTEIISSSIIVYDNNEIDDILDRIELDGTLYYYENKENGKVYNCNSECVGIFKNNEISLNI